jgi:hypothetical protein
LTDLPMRARLAYLAVLLTGLTLIGVALSGMRGMDTTLQVAAAHESPQQVLEPTSSEHPGCHRGPRGPEV